MFSYEFLSFLVIGSLVWCAVSALALLGLLLRDLMQGSTW